MEVNENYMNFSPPMRERSLEYFGQFGASIRTEEVAHGRGLLSKKIGVQVPRWRDFFKIRGVGY